MSWLNFLSEMSKTLTDNENFSLDPSQDTESQVSALALWATQLMWASAKIWKKNLTWVLLKAKDKIIDDAVLKKIDEDKIIRLIQLSTQFSSEEMQEYIALILAWEYNQPWSFSLKTLEIVRNLGKKDIELFRKFWWLVFDGRDFFSKLYELDQEVEVMAQLGLSYDKYQYLTELWLVSTNDSERYMWSNIPDNVEAFYEINIQWKTIVLKKKWKSELAFSSLTTAWMELLPIIWFEENDTLLELVKSEFIRQWFYE